MGIFSCYARLPEGKGILLMECFSVTFSTESCSLVATTWLAGKLPKFPTRKVESCILRRSLFDPAILDYRDLDIYLDDIYLYLHGMFAS